MSKRTVAATEVSIEWAIFWPLSSGFLFLAVLVSCVRGFRSGMGVYWVIPVFEDDARVNNG